MMGVPKHQLAPAPSWAVQRIPKLLFVWQSAEMDDRVPLREPRRGHGERLLERRVLPEIELRRTARRSREERFELSAGEPGGGKPIGKLQIPAPRAQRQRPG